MYVCMCSAVTESQWNAALAEAQADGHAGRAAIRIACMNTGAGMGCGGCREFLAQHSASALALPVLEALPSVG